MGSFSSALTGCLLYRFPEDASFFFFPEALLISGGAFSSCVLALFSLLETAVSFTFSFLASLFLNIPCIQNFTKKRVVIPLQKRAQSALVAAYWNGCNILLFFFPKSIMKPEAIARYFLFEGGVKSLFGHSLFHDSSILEDLFQSAEMQEIIKRKKKNYSAIIKSGNNEISKNEIEESIRRQLLT